MLALALLPMLLLRLPEGGEARLLVRRGARWRGFGRGTVEHGGGAVL